MLPLSLLLQLLALTWMANGAPSKGMDSFRSPCAFLSQKLAVGPLDSGSSPAGDALPDAPHVPLRLTSPHSDAINAQVSALLSTL